MSSVKILSIVVLDHGSPVLLESLSSIFEALGRLKPETWDMTVLTDAEHLPLSLREAEHLYPDLSVKVLPASTGRDSLTAYACSLGEGILLALLNSNAAVAEDFFDKAVLYADKLNLFALAPAVTRVSSLVLGSGETPLWGKIRLDRDFFPEVRPDLSVLSSSLTAFAGFAVFNRKRLIEAGGGEEAGRVRDFFLSFRAWSAGYGVLYDPGLRMRCLPVSVRGDKFQPVPVSGVTSFIDRMLWNMAWAGFLVISGLSRRDAGFSWFRFFSLRLACGDILGLLSFLTGALSGIFQKKPPLPEVFYPPSRIREITDPDGLPAVRDDA